MRHFFAKFLDPVFDTRKLHGSTGVVGCLHHAEIAREVEGLVHIEGCYELPSEKVTAGIAGYDNSEQGFVVEPRGPEQPLILKGTYHGQITDYRTGHRCSLDRGAGSRQPT